MPYSNSLGRYQGDGFMGTSFKLSRARYGLDGYLRGLGAPNPDVSPLNAATEAGSLCWTQAKGEGDGSDVYGTFMFLDYNNNTLTLFAHADDGDDQFSKMEAYLSKNISSATATNPDGRKVVITPLTEDQLRDFFAYWNTDYAGKEVDFPVPMAKEVPGTGTSGAEMLQEFLKENDYYEKDVDGEWGDASKSAMKAFQKEMGVEETGEPTADSLKKIYPHFSLVQDSTTAAQAPVPGAKVKPAGTIKPLARPNNVPKQAAPKGGWMKKVKKVLPWVLLVGAAGGGAYLAYQKWWARPSYRTVKRAKRR